MEGFLFGISVVVVGVMLFVALILHDMNARDNCAKVNNVYDCKLVKTWVPLPQTK